MQSYGPRDKQRDLQKKGSVDRDPASANLGICLGRVPAISRACSPLELSAQLKSVGMVKGSRPTGDGRHARKGDGTD